MQTRMQSYLPGLPSIDEAREDYKQVTSDHAPILTTIPCSEINTGLSDIKILSWNVLEEDKSSASGYSANGEISYHENDNQREHRHLRIAKTLAAFIQNQKDQPQFITLQEIQAQINEENAQPSLYQLITKMLPGYRSVVSKGKTIDAGDCITFYRDDQFDPVVEDDGIKDGNDDLHAIGSKNVPGNITKFKSRKNLNYEIRVANIHHKFTENVVQQEKTIKHFLAGDDKDKSPLNTNKETLSIIVGDFNGTIAPMDEKDRNIITSVSPSYFREQEPEVKSAIESGLQVQGAWAIDGCFYAARSNQQEEVTFLQATTAQLNPFTGMPLIEAEHPLSTVELPTLQQKEILNYRLAISVDERYKTEKLIKDSEDNRTIYSYEQELQQNFGPFIQVRRAVNLNNSKGIGIVINKELYDYFLLVNNRNFQLNAKVDLLTRKPFYVVYTNDQYINQLVDEMQFAVNNKNLIAFAEKIQGLNTNRMRAIQGTLNALKNLFTGIYQERKIENKTYHATVIEHFTGVVNRISQRPMSLNQVQQSADDLDRALYGKPLMSKKMKVLIGGVFGALVGLTLGIAIGVGLTWWMGGFGAIPAMFIGMTKGFTVGTAIALGATGAGLLAGGTAGFFTAKHQEKNRKLKSENYSQTIDQGQEAIYRSLRR